MCRYSCFHHVIDENAVPYRLQVHHLPTSSKSQRLELQSLGTTAILLYFSKEEDLTQVANMYSKVVVFIWLYVGPEK